MERRRFIVKAGGVLAAAGAAAVVDAPNVIAQPKVQWRMSTALDSGARHALQGSAERLAKVVDEMSGGRFRIEVFPGGQIMAPFECFDAASQGTIEAFMASSLLLERQGAGVRVVRDRPVRHEPRRAWRPGSTRATGSSSGRRPTRPSISSRARSFRVAPQMAGWFRKKMNTIGDYKGLKMRIA